MHAVTVTPAMQAGAEQLLASPDRWTPARRKSDGRQFWIVVGRTGTYYTAADGRGCTCPGYARRGICSHSLAATMREAQQAARQAPLFACTFPQCAEPTEQPRTLCSWHRERQARLRAELVGA